jgi:hypothetical protein
MYNIGLKTLSVPDSRHTVVPLYRVILATLPTLLALLAIPAGLLLLLCWSVWGCLSFLSEGFSHVVNHAPWIVW